MTIFEYIAVLVSIIVGLGITHILAGVARLIQHPGRARAYWVHLLWALYCFISLIFFWWWEFSLSGVEQWTFFLYLFVVFYAVLYFSLCSLLFPADLDGYEGYEDYFFSRRRWFFGLLAAVWLVDIGDTLMKGGWAHFESFGWEYPFRIALYVVLSLVAMKTRNRRFHGTFAVLGVIYQLSYILREFQSLQ